jgi:hydrogenase nickel incorporation protein HypA/HybF
MSPTTRAGSKKAYDAYAHIYKPLALPKLAPAAIPGLAEMHELALTRNIVETVAAHAQGRRVRRVTLEVGGLACVMPSALQFCFEVATLGTALEGASLDIIELEAQARCRVCGNTFVQRAFWEPCHCGAHDFTRISGEELRVKQYEVDAS